MQVSPRRIYRTNDALTISSVNFENVQLAYNVSVDATVYSYARTKYGEPANIMGRRMRATRWEHLFFRYSLAEPTYEETNELVFKYDVRKSAESALRESITKVLEGMFPQ